jgi:hypothetical protein
MFVQGKISAVLYLADTLVWKYNLSLFYTGFAEVGDLYPTCLLPCALEMP